ncbi:HTTM domain-containing protein [Natronorubrum sp. DTA7]|uniref:HTTM domain-containing protein n=1 Tax=Natronorubrum sp. DTA7 TaxID=3447016 RepID=UPI003F84C8AC
MDGDRNGSQGQPATGGCRDRSDRLEAIREAVRSRFEIDTRSLAALRIALGLLLLLDLIHRAGAIERFYTDDGAYPLAAYEAAYPQFSGLSLHAASGELWFQQLLFVVAALFAVALIAGYRTRVVALVSLLLLLSLHGRNPAVLNGGDRLLRVLLLVALLTPLGERWSVDAVRRGTARTTVVGVTTAALLVQPLAVFTQNAILKHRGTTWYAGEAVEIALANDAMTIYLGNHLGSVPALLEAINWIWITLLAGSVAFLLLPVGRLRAAVALVYIGAFLGMIPTISIGLFPLVLAAAILPFLTSPFWEAVDRVRSSRRFPGTRPIAAHLAQFNRRPAERRLLDRHRRSDRESARSVVRRYGRSGLTVLGVIVLGWILLFGAVHATGHDVPEEIDTPLLEEQRWGLYAPDPSDSYSWYVVEAELDDGTTVDALEGGAVTTDRPPDASQEYDTFRDRKFMEAVRDSGSGPETGITAERYADWACERADRGQAGAVERVTVHRFDQPSSIEGPYEEPSRTTVIEWEC